MNHALYRKHNDGSHNSSTYHKKDGTPMRHILKQEAAAEIEESLKGTLEEPVSIRALVQAAMDLAGDKYRLDDCSFGADQIYSIDELLDFKVCPISNNGPDFPAFTLYSSSFIYFPMQNDMGVKWVSSVPQLHNSMYDSKVIRV